MMLGRTWDLSLPYVMWVLLNPSVADETRDDMTVVKCCGFAERWGAGGIVIANLLSRRSTKPELLRSMSDSERTCGANDAALRMLLDAARELHAAVVVGWGSAITAALTPPMQLAHVDRFRQLARSAGVTLQCIGTTQAGHPRHPSRTGYDAKLALWDAA